MKTILITGASGTNGKALVKALLKRAAICKLASRTPENLAALNENQESVYFDFEDKESYEKATTGVDAVFLLAPPLDLDIERKLSPFIDFLKEKGIKRVVYVSGIAADKMNGVLDFHPILEEK